MTTKHAMVETNGIRMHVAEEGQGPLVLLCHGFPESWYSWRHQLSALAQGGFRAVAPDMRGYGKTDGDRDLVVTFKGMDQLIPNLARHVPNLRRTLMLPGCGHWTQQERPEEVNAALIGFLREL